MLMTGSVSRATGLESDFYERVQDSTVPWVRYSWDSIATARLFIQAFYNPGPEGGIVVSGVGTV